MRTGQKKFTLSFLQQNGYGCALPLCIQAHLLSLRDHVKIAKIRNAGVDDAMLKILGVDPVHCTAIASAVRFESGRTKITTTDREKGRHACMVLGASKNMEMGDEEARKLLKSVDDLCTKTDGHSGVLTAIEGVWRNLTRTRSQ
eukprot:GFYU01024219.1.p1 GENE.GFYU01024219.1~~GFYU01024219.1.p1  ORF type:complete len:159 (-),score=14.51 GFYU01024219.1:22-453(-)